MDFKNKVFWFRFKLAGGLLVMLLAVSTFLAANGLNELQVEENEAGNISVEFKDADISDVLRVLAMKGNVSIVADPDVKGLVTVQISDVPWEKVLDVISRTYGFAYEREGNIIRVTTQEKQGMEELSTEVFTLNYAKAEQVTASITEMKSERGKVRFDPRANMVIVTDVPTNIYRMQKIIERLDAITPQVTIEARIIETSLSNGEDLGIKWNTSAYASGSSRPTTFPWGTDKGYGDTGSKFLPLGDATDSFHSIINPAFPLATTADFTFGVLDASSFSVLLEAIVTKTDTNILSNPRITTMDNQPAKIHVGTDWPIAQYSYNEETDRFVITGWEYKSYGVLLEVTPTINKDGYVTLKLHPEISDKQEEIDFQGARVPVLSTQTADATVMIKDGHTLVIGGLLKDKKVITRSKVPILGSIPLLGLLFTHKSETIEKKDLMIFITPHIVDNAAEQKLVKRVLDVEENNRKKAEKEAELVQLKGEKSEAISGVEEEPEGSAVTPEAAEPVTVESEPALEKEAEESFNFTFPEDDDINRVPENEDVETKLPETAEGVEGPEAIDQASVESTEESVKEEKGFFFRKKKK